MCDALETPLGRGVPWAASGESPPPTTPELQGFKVLGFLGFRVLGPYGFRVLGP